jgi:hypothetical protein
MTTDIGSVGEAGMPRGQSATAEVKEAAITKVALASAIGNTI